MERDNITSYVDIIAQRVNAVQDKGKYDEGDAHKYSDFEGEDFVIRIGSCSSLMPSFRVIDGLYILGGKQIFYGKVSFRKNQLKNQLFQNQTKICRFRPAHNER